MIKINKKNIVIPTYGVGKEEKNPMFFEKRVYQGSSGKVYPYPVIEKIHDSKINQTYNAVVLENDWLYVIVLPELGGRIYTAYDKTNGFDFVYHNKVIKPALVGLLGPWISGGIEFNWPQHHRPTTYKGVDYKIRRGKDSVSVFVGETEKMFGLKHTTEIKIYKDKAYIEINTDIYNNYELPQTFLWWANPAFKVNDNTKTVMPLDVTAVMDHGKRAVSEFPISKSVYYKADYTGGVDISRYKNIKVPTSFMAYKSKFDFIGGYDCEKRAGLLHIADRHISPGKKQWTWGSGDFGLAWDRNLTDVDGPYVELMTGCFTDNQPDFTYIQPHEKKSFTQYFLPYKDGEVILNANEDICIGKDERGINIYSSINTVAKVKIIKGQKIIIDKDISFKPTETFYIAERDENLSVLVNYNGKQLKFNSEKVEKFEIPNPATPCPTPKECKTNEELYFYGLHIEQYRHATRLAEDYYLEGLRRDETDYRLNFSYGLLILRRGLFKDSLIFFKKAIEKENAKNTNPITTESYFYLGVAYFYLNELDNSYENFYKCIWSKENKEAALYYLSVISFRLGNKDNALKFIRDAIELNGSDNWAKNCYAVMLINFNKRNEANKIIKSILIKDPIDLIANYLLYGEKKESISFSAEQLILISRLFFDLEDFNNAKNLIKSWLNLNGNQSMVLFYLAYTENKLNKPINDTVKLAVECFEDGKIIFPNSLTDMLVLENNINIHDNYVADYLLGNLYYDKKQYEKAAKLWERAVILEPNFPTAKRNLALYHFNKKKDGLSALKYLNEAYELNKKDSRLLNELFQLYKTLNKPLEEQLRLLCDNLSAVIERDDLYLEYIAAILKQGEVHKAEKMISERKFHPWEGGEGKVTKLYKQIKCILAKMISESGDYEKTIAKYKECLVFPHNLGEGKLPLDYDNDVFYFMGETAEKFDYKEDAKNYFRLAVRGNNTVNDDFYYNDNPIEYIYYSALAYKKLEEPEKALKIKNAFINYYENNKNKNAETDYFAVSLPDMLIWEQDLNERNKRFCNYVLALSKDI